MDENGQFFSEWKKFKPLHYLNYPKTKEKIDEKHFNYITKSGFFSFTRYALWRVTILELHKLLSDNKETDKYNLHHLIRKFKKGGIYQSLAITESKIEEWESELKNHNQSITEVSNLRFKLYAHTDNNYKNIIDNSELTLKATEGLINVIVKIVFDIYSIILDTHYVFKPIYKKESVGKIIDDILSKRELDRNKIIETFKENANKKTRANHNS